MAPPAKWLQSMGGDLIPEDWCKAYKGPAICINAIHAAAEYEMRKAAEEEKLRKKAMKDDKPAEAQKQPKEKKQKEKAPKEKAPKASLKSSSSSSLPSAIAPAAKKVVKPKAPKDPKEKKEKVKKVNSESALPLPPLPAFKPIPLPPLPLPKGKRAAPIDDAEVPTKLPSGKRAMTVRAKGKSEDVEAPNFYASLGKLFVGNAKTFQAPPYVGLLVVDSKQQLTLRPLVGNFQVSVGDVQMANVPSESF